MFCPAIDDFVQLVFHKAAHDVVTFWYLFRETTVQQSTSLLTE